MPTISVSRDRRSLILALVCVAQFMVILDISIVNVALPSIRTSLHFDTAGLQWVVNAYTIAFAGFLLLGGRAADLYGQKRLFMIGLGLFGIASVAGGLANSQGLLIAARAFQGLGGAVLSPATLTILVTTFTEPRERARAMGLWSALAGAGGAAGALLGGTFTDFLSWRWVFIINIPLAAVALIAATSLLKAGDRKGSHLDLGGAMLVTAGLVSIVYGIVSVERYGLISPQVIGSVIAGIVLLTWFALHEHRVAREPIMPLSLWKIGSLASANVTMLLMSCGMFAMWYLISLDLQNVHGYSPFATGLAFLPQTLAIVVASQISSRLLGRIGARPIVISASLLAAVGLFWCSTLGETGSFATTYLVPGVLVTFGLGLAVTPVVASSTAGVQPELAGLASGMINTARQVGGSIGLASLATVAANHTASVATSEPMRLASHDGYTQGLFWAGVFLVLSAFSALGLSKVAPRRPNTQRETPSATELVEA